MIYKWDMDKLLDKAIDRNICVFDKDAQSGQFTTRLLSLLEEVMCKNTERGLHVTDILLSPSAYASIPYIEGGKISFHIIDELGYGNDYNKLFFAKSGTLMDKDSEFVIALALDGMLFDCDKLPTYCVMLGSF